MMVKVIKESIEQFFARGRKIARLADEGKAIPYNHIIVNRRPKLSTNRRPIVSTFRLIEHCFCGV